ncbi:MAG TPA: alpha/beta fold hydrolase [Candidatus Peribacterales bacterium]|nr:alpha/beta fold hydrolase [Candidatus Peribacterales bacterium]
MKPFLTVLLLLTACMGRGSGKILEDVKPLPLTSSSSSTSSSTSSTSSSEDREELSEEPSPLEQVPSELSIAHLGSMKLEGTELMLEYVISTNTAYTQHAISYKSNGLTVSGILNIPEGEGPFPLVIFNHGHIPASIYTRGRGLRREQDYLAREGFAVLHTDYRGHGESDESPDTRMVYDAGLEYAMDSINAVLAVREAKLPKIDSTRVGMLGHSLGGGVTLNVLTSHPEIVNAAVLYAPVNSDAWENFTRWRDEREEGDRTREALGTREENPSAWDALSSLTELSNLRAPILLFHGTEDSDVPEDWSDTLSQRLTELGKEVTYIEYEGEKHEFIPKWKDFMEKTASFLHQELTPVDPS